MPKADNKTTFYGRGRRKTASARVYLESGGDETQVNGQDVTAYFPTEALQNIALAPLETTSTVDEFGFSIKVEGGGKNAQAEAVQLGLARAIEAADPGHHTQLKKAGLLSRDPRMKERKKPGLKRARRAPQFSKR